MSVYNPQNQFLMAIHGRGNVPNVGNVPDVLVAFLNKPIFIIYTTPFYTPSSILPTKPTPSLYQAAASRL